MRTIRKSFSTQPLCLIEKIDRVAVVKLNNRRRMNQINQAFVSQIKSAVAEISRNNEIRCIVITGDSRAFSIGGHPPEIMAGTLSEAADSDRGCFLYGLYQTPIPVIAAVNGLCLGGGFSMAIQADIILASDHARFTLPETAIGALPLGGISGKLAGLIGKSRTMEIVLGSGELGAEEALELGIVNKIFPSEDLLGGAIRLA